MNKSQEQELQDVGYIEYKYREHIIQVLKQEDIDLVVIFRPNEYSSLPWNPSITTPEQAEAEVNSLISTHDTPDTSVKEQVNS